MLKHGEVNPLNIFDLRELDHCPPHFTQVEISQYSNLALIRAWILENLDGRFSVKQDTARTLVGFEIPGESTYFMLSLDQITANKILFFT